MAKDQGETGALCVAYMPRPDLIDRNINISAYLDSARLGSARALALVAYVTVARILQPLRMSRGMWGALVLVCRDPGLSLVCHPDEQLVKLSVQGAKERSTRNQDLDETTTEHVYFAHRKLTRTLHQGLMFYWASGVSKTGAINFAKILE